jgi:hypothetical protein
MLYKHVGGSAETVAREKEHLSIFIPKDTKGDKEVKNCQELSNATRRAKLVHMTDLRDRKVRMDEARIVYTIIYIVWCMHRG